MCCKYIKNYYIRAFNTLRHKKYEANKYTSRSLQTIIIYA